MSSNSPNRKRLAASEAGFTLIEVIISVMILSFISLGIYQMTTETFHLRNVLSADGEFYNGIRMAMDIVGRDVSATYSPSISRAPETQPSPSPGAPPANSFQQPPAQAPELQALLQTDLGRTTQFWLPAIDKFGVRPSRFVGSERKMTFVSLSHSRIYRDSPESVFAKITYEVVRDEGEGVIPDTQVLVRTENPNAFEDDDRRDKQQARKYPLLHGIKKLRFRYWRKDKDRWETSWDNDKEDFREKFPDIIEVTFEVVGPEKLSFDGIYKFRPEVPLRGLDPST